MYTLHIANKNYSSWSLRPWVLMTQLKIPFTEKLHGWYKEALAEPWRDPSHDQWIAENGEVVVDNRAEPQVDD